MGRTAAILGPTGLVGNYVLDLLLKNKDYDIVYAFTRRKIEKEHPRLRQIQANFEDLDFLKSTLITEDIYCCLGTTIRKAKSKANFKKIDYSFPLNCAKVGVENGARRFMLVSSVGANPSSPSLYLKTKGELERDLQDFAFESINIFRPSFLKGNRVEFRLMEQISLPIVSFLSLFMVGKYSKYKPIDGMDLAKAMMKSAFAKKYGIHMYHYNEIIALANNYQKISI